MRKKERKKALASFCSILQNQIVVVFLVALKMSQKITTSDITSPVLLASSKSNIMPESSSSSNEGGGSSIGGGSGEDMLCQLPSSNSLIKQKSFSFLMSKQLIRRPTSSTAISTMSSGAVPLQEQGSTNTASAMSGSYPSANSLAHTHSFYGGNCTFSRHNSTSSTLHRGNFIKTKTSVYTFFVLFLFFATLDILLFIKVTVIKQAGLN